MQKFHLQCGHMPLAASIKFVSVKLLINITNVLSYLWPILINIAPFVSQRAPGWSINYMTTIIWRELRIWFLQPIYWLTFIDLPTLSTHQQCLQTLSHPQCLLLCEQAPWRVLCLEQRQRAAQGKRIGNPETLHRSISRGRHVQKSINTGSCMR